MPFKKCKFWKSWPRSPCNDGVPFQLGNSILTFAFDRKKDFERLNDINSTFLLLRLRFFSPGYHCEGTYQRAYPERTFAWRGFWQGLGYVSHKEERKSILRFRMISIGFQKQNYADIERASQEWPNSIARTLSGNCLLVEKND